MIVIHQAACRGAVRILAAAVLVVALRSGAHASLVTESCNDVAPNFNLAGTCGGTGWDSACWVGINAEPICAYSDVVYAAPGYSNAGNIAGRGGRIGDGGNLIISRHLPTPVIGGCAWVSFSYANFPNTNVTRDDISFGEFGGGSQPLKFGIESRNDRAPRGFIEFNGAGAPGRVWGPVVNIVEPGLAIVKVCVNVNELGHDDVRIWTNPQNLLGGEAGLGEPDTLLSGYDAIPSFSTLFIQQEVKNGTDALRVSFSGDTPASLAEVLGGTPVGLSRAARTCLRTLDAAVMRAVRVAHRELATCRAAIDDGDLKITPPDCDNEAGVRAAIVAANLQLRARVARSCSETDLVTLPTCGHTVEELVSNDGTTGCAVEAVRQGVQRLLDATHGQ